MSSSRESSALSLGLICWGLMMQGDTGCHKASKGDTRPHKTSQGDWRRHKATQGVKRHHKASQGDTRPHKTSQGDSRRHKATQGVTRSQAADRRYHCSHGVGSTTGLYRPAGGSSPFPIRISVVLLSTPLRVFRGFCQCLSANTEIESWNWLQRPPSRFIPINS
jgi:hypothetical protein